jgi:hypothetical protein
MIRGSRRAMRVLIPSLLVLSLATLAARGAPPVPPAAGDAPALFDYVGALRVEAPSQSEFLLHGTLPLARKTWTDAAAVNPLVVLDYNHLPVLTQTEVVSRYASPSDGVDVAEVIARVHRPPGFQPGDEVIYGVVYAPSSVPPPPAPSLLALQSVTSVPPSVRNLIGSANGIQIEARDPFGNRYLAQPFDGTGTIEIMRNGPLTSEIKVSTTLKPSPVVPGPQGTLPHHLGVQAYITVSSKEEIVGLDLRFHNGHSGKDKTTSSDDPLDDVFFRSINLYVPDGWFVIQDYFDPYLALPTKIDGSQLFPLVTNSPDGKVHPMKWLQQFHRRLAISPASLWPQAQEKIRGAGLGFATRGVSPLSGKALWSWWNPATSRWFPQAHRLPSLTHLPAGEVEDELKDLFDNVVNHLVYGYGDGVYPIEVGVLGYAHPYGVSYAGMTSGSEIYLVDGVPTMEAASLDGYRLARVTHRMQSDRMPDVLYDGDGTPSTVKDWLIPLPGGKDYVPFQHFHQPQLTSQDPFGVWLAPSFQQDYVESHDLQAGYGDELLSFESHDFQHFIRYTRSAKTLTWMANDSLAKDDLRVQAEMFHLSYHEYFNSADGYTQVSGLKAEQEDVAEHPHIGVSFGRGEAWGLDTAVAAYATGSPSWRSANRPWLDAIAKVVADGQMTCTGFIQASVNEHFADGSYRSRQIIEQSIIENALRGLAETVYRGQDSGMLKLVEDTLRASLYSMLNPMAWGYGQGQPWATTAVGPLDSPLVYCDISQVPPDGHSDYTDGFQNWSSFAYGFEMTNDLAFLQFAQVQYGWPLFEGLLHDGTANIENRAALLALVEGFAGMP